MLEDFYDQDFGPTVCILHMRFVPCRKCEREGLGLTFWSQERKDVERVREYQEAVRNNDPRDGNAEFENWLKSSQMRAMKVLEEDEE